MSLAVITLLVQYFTEWNFRFPHFLCFKKNEENFLKSQGIFNLGKGDCGKICQEMKGVVTVNERVRFGIISMRA